MKSLGYLSAVLAGVFVFAVILFPVSAGEGSEPPPAPAPAPADSGKLTLKYSFTKGDSYYLKMTMQQEITQKKLEGKKLKSSQTLSLGYEFSVQDIDNEGNASIKVTYKTLHFKQDGPEKKVEYNSTKPAENTAPETKGFASLVGMSYTMKMSPMGIVSEIEGTGDIISKILEDLDVPDGPMKDQTEKTVKDKFGDVAVKETMEKMMAIFPDHPVGINDTWKKEYEIIRGFPVSLKSTWTLKRRNEGVATLALNANIDSTSRTDAEFGPLKLKYSLTGTQKGTAEIDENTGWIKSSKIKQDISGEVTVTSGAPADTAWPINVKSTITFESTKK
jgi:hypothetical protein